MKRRGATACRFPKTSLREKVRALVAMDRARPPAKSRTFDLGWTSFLVSWNFGASDAAQPFIASTPPMISDSSVVI